jgi:branched-subunit amino acid aminotransferase/4-amino-4-deoxychorismate lyase
MPPPLYESMLVSREGIRLVDRHLARLVASGVSEAVVAGPVAAAVDRACAGVMGPSKLRVAVDGERVGLALLPATPRRPLRLAAVRAFDPADAAREHKRDERAWASAALATARAAGADDALLISDDGLLGETTAANVFVRLADGTLATPPSAGIVPGVTRAWVIERTGAAVRPLRVSDLATARSAFATTAGRGVVGVAAVDARALGEDEALEALHRAWLALPTRRPAPALSARGMSA